MRWTALLLGLAGCWPYISGPGGGPPADAAVTVGSVQYVRYLGAYWEDGSPSLSGWVATVDPPQAIFMIDAYGLPNSCQRNAPLPTWWGGSFATNGSGTASIASDTVAISAPWDPASFAFSGEAASAAGVEPGSWFSVSGVNSGPYGAYVIDNAVYLPSDLQLTAPNMAGATLGTMPAGDLTLQWSGGNDASEILAQALVYDSAGTLVEIIECRMDNTGSFVIPQSQFTQWAGASQVTLAITAAHQADGKVDFHETAGTRMLGSNTLVGAFIPQ